MADPVSSGFSFGSITSAIGIGGIDVTSLLIIIVIVMVLACLLIGGIVFFYWRSTFNQTIRLYGLVGNRPTLKSIHKGKFVMFSTAGDKSLLIYKPRKHVGNPTIQMGKREWWFWERADGEWLNFGLQDLDKIQKEAGAYFVDFDMRMQRLGIEKNLKERLQKDGFWAKYGQTIMGIIFFVLITLCLIILFSKLIDVAKALDNTANSVNNMAETVRMFYAQGGGGSGLIPVNQSNYRP